MILTEENPSRVGVPLSSTTSATQAGLGLGPSLRVEHADYPHDPR